MPGGIYAALSGLHTRTERLDRIAEDISNAATPGYKGDRTTTIAAERPSFSAALSSAVDVMSSTPKADLRDGTVIATGRDLDFAIQGKGFFQIQTPAGIRYTRSGHFTKSSDGTIITSGGDVVLNEDGEPLVLPPGQISHEKDGTIRVGSTSIGRPAVMTFKNLGQLIREDGTHFKAPNGLVAEPAVDSSLSPKMIEESNVLPQERMAQLVGASRSFDALQRSISVLVNDMDGRAITELGRR